MFYNRVLAGKRAALTARAAIVAAIRHFFTERGYLEVETPFRIPAPAPESHIDAVRSEDWFLHTSPELCMKRLLAAGYEKTFQICRCWRSGERGSRHTPEFTLLEWYRTGSDYNFLMEECEQLLGYVVEKWDGRRKISYFDLDIDLSQPWERITVREAFKSFAKISMEEALAKELFDQVMVEDIEPRLGLVKPTFIYDYPASRSALAQLKHDDQTVAERFELYIGGLELANAFTELTDADEQRTRFVAEEEYRRASGMQPYPLPEKFLKELHTMPPAAGIAFGIDRLVMVLLNKTAIDDVVAFTPEEL